MCVVVLRDKCFVYFETISCVVNVTPQGAHKVLMQLQTSV